jgi:hypothetical protein
VAPGWQAGAHLRDIGQETAGVHRLAVAPGNRPVGAFMGYQG